MTDRHTEPDGPFRDAWVTRCNWYRHAHQNACGCHDRTVGCAEGERINAEFLRLANAANAALGASDLYSEPPAQEQSGT